jgi:hypothetical protein
MKTLTISLFSFVMLLTLSTLFLSCSSENSITQPPEGATNTKPLAKVTTASIDHNKDTLITLPKSGKTIEIEKVFRPK